MQLAIDGQPVTQDNKNSSPQPIDQVASTNDLDSSEQAFDLADTICTEHGDMELSGPVSANQLGASSMAHFKIVDILGKGGMGAVYKAKDLALERFVAIKTLRIAGDQQPLILAEAKTISQLNHPNIVTVHDIARDDDENFIVMEWIDGQPLSAVIPSQGLPLVTVLNYAKQMVAALACAHQQGIIHRDIKPQNIMLDANGQIKMLDFGIATLQREGHGQMQREGQEQTSEQNAAGSPQYRSPEQTLAKPCDARSDLFSLGVVLYEMLAGVKPFLGLNIKQIGEAITSGNYTPLAECLSDKNAANHPEHLRKNQKDILIEVIDLVDKLLQVDPEQRYQSAEQLAKDIKVIDEKVNQKQTWWQQQHGLTKAFVLLPLIAVLGWSLRSVLFPPSTQELVARQLLESKKIAFLPFDNISGDPVLQIFSDGIATMLSSDLAEVGYQQGDGSTWVLPTSEIRKLEDPSVNGIYNKYGVDVIVTGSIQHMGSTRSLHLTLVNGIDGRVLKSTQLTLDANKLFDAQTDVRQQVMVLLGWQIPENLAQAFAAKKPALDGAYKHYLQGQGYLYRFDHGDNINNALKAFQAAIDIDTNYADAYASLAQAQLHQFVESNDMTFLTQVKQSLMQLQQLKPEHRFVNYLQGELALKQGEYQQAINLFNQTIILAKNFSMAHLSLAKAYQGLSQLDNAEKALIHAQELMPTDNFVLTKLGVFYYSQGNYLEAIRYFEQLALQAPNNHIAYLNISACYYLTGNIEQAIIAVQKSLAIKPEADGYANLGTMYFILKKYDNAVTAYEQMIILDDSDYINWGNLADAYRFAKNEKYVNAFKQAIGLAREALKINPNNKMTLSSLAYYYANTDNREQSLYNANQITRLDSGQDQFFIAAAYARLGQNDAAIRYLTFAIENQYSVAEITNSPLLESLQSELAFQQLINGN